MPSGRVKGTKLSAEHCKNVSSGLKEHFKTNTVWNKGTRKPKRERTEEEKRIGKEKRYQAVLKGAATKRRQTLEKRLEVLKDDWANVEFSAEGSKEYISLTHRSCGTNLKVQVQTIAKWAWGAGLCKKCNPIFRGTSQSETELADFVLSVQPGAQRHLKLPNGTELDIFCPITKIGIEYNGLYWHSDKAGYSRTKHLEKLVECERLGYRLIQIFEDEWLQKPEIVKSRVRAILGKTLIKTYARKLKLDLEVPSKEAREFLDRTHIQGNASSSIRLGLRENGVLKAIMTFGKARFNKKISWELIRFSTELNYQVVGGASRLLAAFRKGQSGSLISYADRRWSAGSVYVALGFTKVGESAPAYFYFKGDLRHNRQNFQKAKLKKVLAEAFDESKTEVELMFEAGWNRIWDCGNLIYVLPERIE